MACECCFCNVPLEEATTMECSHTFCNDCWQQHIRVQVMDGKSRKLACMAVKCGAVCDEDKVFTGRQLPM